MGVMLSQITSLTIVYSNVYSGADKKKNIKAPRHWTLWGEFSGDRSIPLTKDQWIRKMFPFDDAIMFNVSQFQLRVGQPIFQRECQLKHMGNYKCYSEIIYVWIIDNLIYRHPIQIAREKQYCCEMLIAHVHYQNVYLLKNTIKSCHTICNCIAISYTKFACSSMFIVKNALCIPILKGLRWGFITAEI